MFYKIKAISQLVVVFTVLTISGSVGLIIRIGSLGYLLNFNRKYFVPFFSKLILRIIGMQLQLPKEDPIKNGQYLITFNHNSYFDIFALTALGYPNTIFLLSEKTIKIIPVTLLALSIGVRYIPQQHRTNRRLNFFKKMESIINRKKLNIAGASEGVHEHHHGIDRFNKGIYHLATVCRLNIIPLFINVPEESNPFNKYNPFKTDTVKISILETVATENWVLDDLENNKDKVRAMFVKKFNTIHNTSIT